MTSPTGGTVWRTRHLPRGLPLTHSSHGHARPASAADVSRLRLAPQRERHHVDNARSETRVRQRTARWGWLEPRLLERLKEQVGAQNGAKKPPSCSRPEADDPAPSQGRGGDVKREVMRRVERHALKGTPAKLLLTDGPRSNIYDLGAASRLAPPSSSSAELAWLWWRRGVGRGEGGGQRPAQSQREGGDASVSASRPESNRCWTSCALAVAAWELGAAAAQLCSSMFAAGHHKPSHLTPDLREVCPLWPRFHQFVSICPLCIYTPSISDWVK